MCLEKNLFNAILHHYSFVMHSCPYTSFDQLICTKQFQVKQLRRRTFELREKKFYLKEVTHFLIYDSHVTTLLLIFKNKKHRKQ